MELLFLVPIGMLVVMWLLAAIGLPGSRRSWEPPTQPAPGPLTPQTRAAMVAQQAPRTAMPTGMLPLPPGGSLALVPLRGAR